MRILLVYHLRLGDIARCLPIAKHFADQGHEVDFECLPEYRGLFALVPYCRPVTPSARPGYDRIIDLQIWPNRMAEWKASPMDWIDFVYGLLPEGGEINRQIVLSPPRDLAPSWLKESVACFPTGYSQEWPVHPAEALAVAHKVAAGAPVLAIGKRDHGMAELPTIKHLCAYIQQAKQVVTINTSASILASALRPNWVHIADHPKHDWKHPNQIRIERADTAPTA
jgi:ADP-heptose:LPS heptosyltransferase